MGLLFLLVGFLGLLGIDNHLQASSDKYHETSLSVARKRLCWAGEIHRTVEHKK
jgi:hypothetical protein